MKVILIQYFTLAENWFIVILVSTELQDIHVKLLRKLKRSVNPEKWEKAIIKFCYFYGGSDDGKNICQPKGGEVNLLQF